MKRPKVWRRALAALVFVGALVGGGAYFSRQAAEGDRELPVYVRGAERMAAGEEVYLRGAEAKPFTYPPFAAVPFAPLAKLPAAWQPPVWFAVNFLLLLALLRWLHRWHLEERPFDGPPRRVAFWLLTAALGAHFVVGVFQNQSHDLLILATVTATAAAWSKGSALAGVWAGAGAAMKATPLLFLVLFALRRRALAALCLAAAVIGLSLVPDLLWPRRDGRLWSVAWYELNVANIEVGATANTVGVWNPHAYLNQSLAGTMTRLFTPAPPPGADGANAKFVDPDAMLLELPPAVFRSASWAAQLAVLAALAWGILRAGSAVRRAPFGESTQRVLGLGEAALIACGMVLLSPQSSKAHFCVWLLPAAFLADRAVRGRRDPLAWSLLACAIALGLLATKGLVGKEIGNRLLAHGNVTWATVLLLAATVRALATPLATFAPAGDGGGPGQRVQAGR